MPDESRLDAAAAKALRAQELLDNQLLAEAFKSLEESYASAWRGTTIDDVSSREKLFLAINIVGKVRDHLNAVIANGRLAEAELSELARTGERRKRFGIL
jgi:hypothetical protein